MRFSELELSMVAVLVPPATAIDADDATMASDDPRECKSSKAAWASDSTTSSGELDVLLEDSLTLVRANVDDAADEDDVASDDVDADDDVNDVTAVDNGAVETDADDDDDDDTDADDGDDAAADDDDASDDNDDADDATDDDDDNAGDDDSGDDADDAAEDATVPQRRTSFLSTHHPQSTRLYDVCHCGGCLPKWSPC